MTTQKSILHLYLLTTFGPGSTDLGKITKPAMARGTTNSTLTAITDNTRATATSHDRDGGAIRPSLIASSPRRKQRRLLPESLATAPFAKRKGARRLLLKSSRAGDARLPSAGRAGSGFPRMDRRVAQWGPRITSHTAQPGPSRAVSYPWTRNVDPISLHGRDHGVSWSPSQ